MYRGKLTPLFKAVFGAAVALTVFFVLLAVMTRPPFDAPPAAHETSRELFRLAQLGAGSIFGMLAGKGI